jgi:hypothetical protein
VTSCVHRNLGFGYWFDFHRLPCDLSLTRCGAYRLGRP